MDLPLPHVTSLSSQQRALLANLSEFYSQQILCDVTLKTDQCAVSCHKLVLSASSPYFRAMFAGGLSERDKDEIVLLGVDSAALQAIVQYMYTSCIDIHNDNVQSVFCGAHLLQMDELCTSCARHMQAKLDTGNCVRMYQFASMHSSYALLNAARTYLLQHFRDINTSPEFMELDSCEVEDILMDDNLYIDDEYIVFESIMNWIQQDMPSRKQYVETLLKTVRFSLIDSEVIEGIVTSLECLKNGALLSQCILDINKHIDDPEVPLRIGMYEREMIIFAGGSQSKSLRSLSCYDPATRHNYFAVQPYVAFDFKFRIDNHKLVITDNNSMYLIGGIFFEDYHFGESGQSLKEVKCFDPFNRCWVNKSSLLQPRCAHAAVYADSHIYAIGGKSTYPQGAPLATVERYSCVDNQWSFTTSMPAGLAHHGAVSFDRSIYVIGGYVDNANTMVRNTLWQFHLDTLSWSEIENRMSVARAESGVALLNGSIYVVGGDNGQYKVCHTEIFNIRERSWRFGPDFPEDRKSMGAVAMHGRMYVCGGTRTVISRINRTPRVVEARDLWKLDQSAGSWSREAKLVQYANSYGCAVGRVNLRRVTESEFVSPPGPSPP